MALTFLPPRPTFSISGPLAQSWELVRSGHIRHALIELETAARHASTEEERAEHAWLLFGCRLAVGDRAAATTAAEGLAPDLQGQGPAAVRAHLAYGELAAARGDHAAALAHHRSAGDLASGPDPVLPPWQAGAALALVRLGDRPAAAALAQDLLAEAEAADARWHTAVALRTVATVDAAADALALLDRARGLARAVGDRRLAAQVDVDLAGLLLLVPAADPAQPVELLRDAEEYAGTEGLWPLHARATRLLQRVGERPRRTADEVVALLTPAEYRVARLAVSGLTNRQIAERLTVSVKGVEWHLSRIYRKLGIRSRQQLRPLLDLPGRTSATA